MQSAKDVRYLQVGFPQRIDTHPELGLSLSILGKCKPVGVMHPLLNQVGGVWFGGDGGRQWLIQPASIKVFIPLLKGGINSEAMLDIVNRMHSELSREYLRIKARYDKESALGEVEISRERGFRPRQ